MRLQFSNILNKNKGTTGIVCGLGPSLKNDLDFIEDLGKDKEKYTTISCNRYHALTNINADYWLIANSQKIMQVPQIKGVVNNLDNTMLLYADSVDTTPKKQVNQLLKNNYIGFDQRHFKGKRCGVDNKLCCNQIEKGRLTIQEELSKYCDSEKRYSNGGSVIVHMLATAIITGCNPIYVTGVDFDYSGDGYVKKDDGNPNGKRLGLICAPDVKNKVKADLLLIKELASNINVEIFSLVENGYLDNIFDVKRPELV